MKSGISASKKSVLVLLACIVSISCWAAAAGISENRILSSHHETFSRPEALVDVFNGLSEDRSASTDDIAARELLLRAISAPDLPSAGETISRSDLSPIAKRMTAEIAAQFWSQLASNAELARAVDVQRERLWSSSAGIDKSQFEGTQAVADLKRAIDAWKTGTDGSMRIQQLSTAVTAWLNSYGERPKLDLATMTGVPPAAHSPAPTGTAATTQRPDFQPRRAGTADVASVPAQMAAPTVDAPADSGDRRTQGPSKADTPDAASAEPTIPMTEALTGLFDADDNLWLNISGIYVFKKGTDHKESVRIPSEEFAHVRATVGVSGKYADYEYWDDPSNGSFREFRTRLSDGGDPDLDIFKHDFTTRPLADLLGRSFGDFRYLLSANPAGVHIISATGITPKQMLARLEFLKEFGLIPAVPPLENIHNVGNPDNPYYASTGSPSKAKLLTAKDILDQLELRAKELNSSGRKAPLLIAPDGVNRAHLMPIGFSDDDKGNIAAMRDGVVDPKTGAKEKGLAEEFAAGRWPDIKISLFYTDREDPEAGNFVITKGGVREMTVEEFSETFYGESAGSKPPAPDEVRSDRASFWDAISDLYFTGDVPGFAHEKVHTNVNQGEMEAHELRAFYDEAPFEPGATKGFTMVRYSISDKPIKDAMKEAKSRGVPGDLITDFNTSMQIKFAQGEKMSSDWTRATPKAGEAGQFIADLVANGWAIQGPGMPVQEHWGIYSQPMYNHELLRMIDIFHKKGLIMWQRSADGKRWKITYIEGSGNLAHGSQRINLIVKTTEPNWGKYALRNAQRFMEAFRQGFPIDKMRPIQPLLILFGEAKTPEEAESLYLGNTDGRFQLNDVFADIIQKAVDNPKDYQYIDEDHYEFVWTFRRGVALTQKALEMFPNAKLYLVGDAKFGTLRGAGKIPIMGGYAVLGDNGFITLPWKRQLRDQVEGFEYARPVEGAVQKDLDGVPEAVYVFHTKIGQLTMIERGKKWLYSKFGTYNYSGHKSNAESMAIARMKPDSPFHDIVRSLMMGHAKAHPEWAVPIWRAPFWLIMSRLVGRRPQEMPLQDVPVMERAIKDQQWTLLAFKLHQSLEKSTTLLRDTFPLGIAQSNIMTLANMMVFYDDLAKAAELPSMNAQKAALPAAALAYKQNNANDIKALLRSFVWERNLVRDQINHLVDWVFDRFGLGPRIETMKKLMRQEHGSGESDDDGAAAT